MFARSKPTCLCTAGNYRAQHCRTRFCSSSTPLGPAAHRDERHPGLAPTSSCLSTTKGTQHPKPQNRLGWKRPPRPPRPTHGASRWAARTGRGSSVTLATTSLEKLILPREDLLEKTKILTTPPINYEDFNDSSQSLPSPGGSSTMQHTQVRKERCYFCAFHHRRAFCASYRSAAGGVGEGTAPRKRQRLRMVSSATKLWRTAPEFT